MPETTEPHDETANPDPAKPGDRTSTSDKDKPANRQDKASERLDEALEETFPSSDPVSVKITK